MEFPESPINFTERLPDEVLLNIFKKLDLKSLAQCAPVCTRWYNISCDGTLYENLYLKRITNIDDQPKINVKMLFKYLIQRRAKVKVLKVELNYYIEESKILIKFLQRCCKQLTHLDLSVFVSHDMGSLANLTKLKSFYIRNTHIDEEILIQIFERNPNLQHLGVVNHTIENVVNAALTNNLKLISWSSSSYIYNTCSLYKFKELKNLDLRNSVIIESRSFFEKLASGCLNLETLNLASCYDCLGNGDIFLPIINKCKNLRWLDLTDNETIELSFYEKICENLPKLKVLRLGQISFKPQFDGLKAQYSHIDIHESLIKTLY